MTYVVVSHKNPSQVTRLVDRLLGGSPTSHVLLHHDPTGEPLPTMSPSARLSEVTPRRRVRWGDSADVHVFVDALRQARRELDPDWIVFLSGQDYPVSRISDIESDLSSARQDVLMDVAPVATASPWPPGDPASRYAFRYVRRSSRHLVLRPIAELIGRLPDPRGRLPDDADWSKGQRFATFRMGTDLYVGVRPLRRVFDAHRRCFVGSQWFSASRRGIDILLAADPGGRLLRHYDRTILADESYFQTLAGNALDGTEIANPRRYILWTDSPHPEVLTVEHLPDILRSGAHFARKFDSEIDATVLDELDRLHS